MTALWVHCGKEFTRKEFALSSVSGHNVREALPRHLGKLIYGYCIVFPTFCTFTEFIHVCVIKVSEVAECTDRKCYTWRVAFTNFYVVCSEYLLKLLYETTTSFLIAQTTAANHAAKIGVCHKWLSKSKDKSV